MDWARAGGRGLRCEDWGCVSRCLLESLLQFSALQFSAFRCLIVSHFQTASIHHVSFGHAIYLGVIFDMCKAHVMNRSRSPMKALAENRSCAENRSYDSTILLINFRQWLVRNEPNIPNYIPWSVAVRCLLAGLDLRNKLHTEHVCLLQSLSPGMGAKAGFFFCSGTHSEFSAS